MLARLRSAVPVLVLAGWILAGRPTQAQTTLLVCQSTPTDVVTSGDATNWGGLGTVVGSTTGVTSARLGPDGMLYVVEPDDPNPAMRVKRYYPDGTVDTTFVIPSSITLVEPYDVAFDVYSGFLFVSDHGAYKIYVLYWKNGTPIHPVPPPIDAFLPTYMVFRNSGLYVAEGNRIGRWVFGQSATSEFVADGLGGLFAAGQFAMTGSRIYVASQIGSRVLEYAYSPNGATYVGVAAGGSGELTVPIGVALDPATGGRMYVASHGTDEIWSYALGSSGPGTLVQGGVTDLQGLSTYAPQIAPFPLKKGELVVTHCPSGAPSSPPSPFDPTVILVDQRYGGPTGQNWPANFFWNQNASSPNSVWNYQNLGSVFGVTTDNASAVNLFVSASTAYGDFGVNTFGYDPTTAQYGGGGEVYKLGGCDGTIYRWMVTGTGAVGTNTLYMDPTNTATPPALGDVAFDARHQQFFISDFEDGKIYRVKDIGVKGVVLSVHDPFLADDGVPGFAPLGERVWALHPFFASPAFPNGVLLFSVWLRDSGRQNTPWPASWGPTPASPNNTIWAWPMTASGSLSGSPYLWRILPHLDDSVRGDLGYSNPVSDITSAESIVFVAERTFYYGDYGRLADGNSAHRARVLATQFTPDHLDVFVDKYRVGDNPYVPGAVGYDLGWNASGGVALETMRSRVYATGDALHYPHTIPTPANDYIYGLQGIPWFGNATLPAPILSKQSKLIDMDHDISGADKSQIGDVDYIEQTSSSLYCPAHPTSGP